MKKLKIATFFLFFSLIFSFFASNHFCFAAPANPLDEMKANVTTVGKGAGLEKSASLPDIVANVIKVMMAISGTILVVLIVYAGFLWMTAGGVDEKVLTAKKYLKNGLIGLVLIVVAYSLTDFVIKNIVNIINPSTP